MTENAEAERQLSQTMSAALSVALNIAMQMQVQRAQNARAALREAEMQQREAARQLAAERETAAVLWRRIDDRKWVETRPEEVAQAWASACAWEAVDPRAAEARAKFEFLLRSVYGEQHPMAKLAREAEDYTALAALLRRATEVLPGQAPVVVSYESVPVAEQQAWLERQVWGPDSDPETRVARSAQLADVERGLPVAVLREMSTEARQASIALQELDPEERQAWRRSWLEREVWGPESDPSVRDARAAALATIDTDNPNLLEPEAWYAWVSEVRERNAEWAAADALQSAAQVGTQPGGDAVGTARMPATRAAEPNRADPVVKPGISAQPVDESAQERLARTAACVREVWPENVAEQVTEREAFVAFAHRLHQLEARGYDMKEVLAMVPPEGLVGIDRYGKPVRDPAAFGEWHIKQLVKSLPEKAATEAGIEQLERYVAEHTGSSTNVAKSSVRSVAEPESASAVNPVRGETSAERSSTREPAGPAEALADKPTGPREPAAETSPGAYVNGEEAAQLAGKSFPVDINESLKAAQRNQAKQGAAGAQARRYQAPQQELGR